MRLFLLNPAAAFSIPEVARRSRVTPAAARRELRMLSAIGFIKSRGKEWRMNPGFLYRAEVEALLINADTLDKKKLSEGLRKLGRVKLLILSGIFIKSKDSAVDLFLVGDALKRAKIEKKIKELEAEIGVELRWAIFSTKEFTYRLNMYDKLVRDVLDFPHEVFWHDKKLSTLAVPKT
jgi:hypothetical protein